MLPDASLQCIPVYECEGRGMTDYEAHAARLKAMAHPVRLQILDMLREGEVCVCHMERALGRRQAYISQQLMVLREAGLVEARKDGLQVFYRLVDAAAAILLDTALGPSARQQPEVLLTCPCPHCAEARSHAGSR
jgi:ArsR family transcriptional regulator